MRKPEKQIIQKLLNQGILQDTSILCVCAGKSEKMLFEELNIKNVTLTNINEDVVEGYKYEKQDAMNLTYKNDSFDYVFVSNGLHHCSSPHRALLEMYRVARKTIIFFESKDSFLMRLAVKFNLTVDYEYVNEIPSNGYGGRNNSRIPNYIYRWTKREFEKTICSYYPVGKNKFRYYHGLDIPTKIEKNKLLTLLIKLVFILFPGNKNVFCAVATKPVLQEDIFPWIRDNAIDYKDILSRE